MLHPRSKSRKCCQALWGLRTGRGMSGNRDGWSCMYSALWSQWTMNSCFLVCFTPIFFFFFLQTSFPCLSAFFLLLWVYTSSGPVACARGAGTSDRNPQKICGLLTGAGEAGQHSHFSRLLKIWWMTEHLSPIFPHFLKQSKLSKH